MRGEVKPAREFMINVPGDRPAAVDTWAICLDSDDHSLLIPRKLYPVKIVNAGIFVRDEAGEMTACDTEDFLPIAFEPEVQEMLSKAA
jgi:hypothetical protein